MQCQAIYDEMMSLKLDGMLAAEDERRLDEHVVGCAACASLWAAMKQADALFCASAAEPVAVPAGLQSKVMLRIAAQSAPLLALEAEPVRLPGMAVSRRVPVVAMASPATVRLREEPLIPQLGLYEWQTRVSSYVRRAAITGLSIAAAAGLVLALVISGVIQVSGPFGPTIEVTRTFVQAVDTWLGSMFTGVGPGMVTVSALVFGLLALAGWQVVTGYHRFVAEQKGNTGRLDTGYLEALS